MEPKQRAPATTPSKSIQQQQQQQQQQQVSSSPLRKATSSVASTSSNYLSNLVNKSSILFDSLKQQFNTTPTATSGAGQPIKCENSDQVGPTNHYHNCKSNAAAATEDANMQPSRSSEANLSLNNNNNNSAGPQPPTGRQRQPIQRSTTTLNRDISSASSGSGGGGASGGSGGCGSAQRRTSTTEEAPPQTTFDLAQNNNNKWNKQANERPPLPPPPPRELVLQVTGNLTQRAPSQTRQQHPSGPQATSGGQLGSPVSRRHALQEHSLERDALTSCGDLNRSNLKSLKDATGGKPHKRASSIKSALRHAHLGPLRPSAIKRRAHAEKLAAREAAAVAAAGGAAHELFEPPITQRTFQRQTRRRGAMQGDPRRQMSADTIGLRQLTDEYLQNAGVKSIAASGPCNLVALGQRPVGCDEASCAGSTGSGGTPATDVVAAVAAATSSPGSGANSLAANQAQCALEAQLYQASRQAAAKLECSAAAGSETKPGPGRMGARPSYCFRHQSSCGPSIGGAHLSSCNSQTSETDSLSHVTILPGSLPWQCDVSIQCELLQAPPMFDEPYETTGDILNTIAGPFRGPHMYQSAGSSAGASFDSTANSHSHHHHHYHLSATLKRGLSAISQSAHLSPLAGSAAAAAGGSSGGPMNTLNVVGSLKKSLSNTLDISKSNHHLRAADLHSQDSLPTYSSFINEPDDDDDNNDDHNNADKDLPRRTSDHRDGPDESQQQQPPHQQEGFINQLASKLTRQSSKKFSVSKKGLQRALSFDCRGYKRLDGQQTGGGQTGSQQARQATTTSGQDSGGSSNGGLFGSRLKANNKSTLALHSPRPYLPQSASQVDFQVPLLPYDRMQEAIVSQRLLGPPPPSVGQPEDDPLVGCGDQRLDADELICGPTTTTTATAAAVAAAKHRDSVESSRRQSGESNASHKRHELDEHRHRSDGGSVGGQQQAPRLVLNIPTIATTEDADDVEADEDNQDKTNANNEDNQNVELAQQQQQHQHQLPSVLTSPNLVAIIDSTQFTCQQQQQQQQAHLNVGMSQSPSFCIDPDGKSYLISHQQQPAGSTSDQLTASDVFSRSKNFIKRPSTMVADSDAMSQVAQALELTSSRGHQQQQNGLAGLANKPAGGSVRRTNRRQAIVPPKLATDANSGSDSEREPRVGHLIDVEDDQDDDQDERRRRDSQDENNIDDDSDELNLLRTNRRKRSGGSNGGHATPRTPSERPPHQRHHTRVLSGSQSNLAGHSHGQQEPPELRVTSAIGRPDSQATNADSIMSSGSSTTLSAYASGAGASGAGGLSVPFAGSTSRRRSSIAVIPHMQICPGDLLVYSKQLIDRMNQTDENEPPAQFLVIDDKKAKNNIWSSFKLCAQFDNRTMRARNELVCALEDILVSMKPSTLKDDQLRHYKGMLWNEFLYETESRRSASSEKVNSGNETDDKNGDLDSQNKKSSYKDDLVEVTINEPSQQTPLKVQQHRRSGSMKGNEDIKEEQGPHSSLQAAREPVKATMSGTGTPVKGNTGGGRFSSRFREKPKLMRGQTVDSVFRIPLIPSSPLKHAQQHQQTPTAHLEDHNLITIEDDERSSLSGGANSQGEASPVPSLTGPLDRRKRSSSTRSRSNPRQTPQQLPVAPNGDHQGQQSGESSFEADDALDLINGTNNNKSGQRNRRSTPNQIVRQSSLSTLSSTITRTEQKRQRALWDLFQSECAFFFDHLLTLKNVYMEPLKLLQVEGFAMSADPDVLFGNLDELCCGVYEFCKEFLCIIKRTLKTRPEDLNATDVLIKLYKKNPKIDHLRALYHRYTLNYINALTYLESLRRQVEFVEFEKWSSRDVRCNKLQLTDLLVAPVQHIMRVPIILKDIESHTEHKHDRDEIRAILAVEEASLRELDDKMRWLKNFERLLEIQKNIIWPSVLELEPKLNVPEFLKEVLSKQPCEKLIVSPRRQIVHEGLLSNFDQVGKPSDLHVILFDDMLLLTRKKKGLTKKASTICKTNSGGTAASKDDGSFKYIVYKQPLSLDRFYVHDVQQVDSQAIGIKHLFLLIVLNRFQQITYVHSFSAPNDDMKQTWLFKLKKTSERWKRNFSGNSNDQQQQQHQQQQQQISPSKSMPVDGRPARVAMQQQQQHHNQHQQHHNQHQQQRSPSRLAGDKLQEANRGAVIDQQPEARQTEGARTMGQNDNGEDRQRLSSNQPIELIVTSASESPNELPTLSNASTVITNTR